MGDDPFAKAYRLSSYRDAQSYTILHIDTVFDVQCTEVSKMRNNRTILFSIETGK